MSLYDELKNTAAFIHGTMRADAGFNEADHPREPETGKFTSGGGGGGKLSDTMKPDPSKYNKQRADYIKKKLHEISKALASADPVGALKAIEVKSGHGKTKAYIDQLVKEHEQNAEPEDPQNEKWLSEIGAETPDPKPGTTPLTASQVTGMSNVDKEDHGMEVAEAYNKGLIDADQMESELVKLGMKPAKAGPGKYTAEWPDDPEPVAAAAKPLAAPEAPKPLAKSEELQKEKDKIESYFGSILPANKSLVEPKLKEIDDALASGDPAKLAAIQPVPSNGAASVTATNKYLANAKAEHATAEQKVASFAKAEATKTAAAAIKGAPHKKIKQTSYYEGPDGKEVEASLDLDTKSIPHGFYDIATAKTKGKSDCSDDASTQMMQDYHDKVWSDIPYKGTIQSYQNNAYVAINKGLAKPPPGDTAKRQIQELDKAMKKAKTPCDLPVYRGIRASFKGVTGFDNPEDAVGRAFEHTAFASVSRSEQISKNFAGGGAYAEATLLKFTLPAGSPGITMPVQAWEKEILLDRNSIFRIDKHEKQGKMTVLHVTYLGHNRSETTING